MQYGPNQLLTSLLRDVSRSFYLTLRVLPSSIRPQIGLAYLLARTTDTIADTELVPLEQRLSALQALRERILAVSLAPSSREDKVGVRRDLSPAPAAEPVLLDFGALAQHQGSPAERVLLEKCPLSLELLGSLAPADQRLVQEVLDTITSGQELDLRRFAGASADHLMALRTEAELDDYTYRVAGCVGEFWTKMCRAHLFPRAPLDEAALLANGVCFGKGLQLVNILRDLPADLRLGRCYLPTEQLAAVGLQPADLLQSANEPRLRPLYNAWLDRAEAHLQAGWTYTNTLPWGCARVRLACAWPVLIGLETLRLLRAGNVLDPQQRIKVRRPQIRQILLRSVLYYPWPGAWRNLGSSCTL